MPAGQPSPPAATPIIRLSGTIHNYKKGNRAERYIISFGAGSAEVDAEVAFLDEATGQRLVVEELRAVLVAGLFGGKEEKVITELARQIVIQARLMLSRRLPAPGAAPITSGSEKGSTALTPLESQAMTIDAKKWPEAEQKLDEEAAAGYRVVGMTLTGSSTADLELEKLAAPPEVYQYRWLHPRLFNHLQKDVNRAVADGFHVSARTLAVLGPFLTVLMEKPPVPSTTQYQYLVAEPFRMSSAQKDTETHEREGYTLLDETELGGVHILLFEKATEEAGKEEK